MNKSIRKNRNNKTKKNRKKMNKKGGDNSFFLERNNSITSIPEVDGSNISLKRNNSATPIPIPEVIEKNQDDNLTKCIMKNGMTEHWNFCTTDSDKNGDTVVYFVGGLGCSENYTSKNYDEEKKILNVEYQKDIYLNQLNLDSTKSEIVRSQFNYICRKYFTALSSIIKTTMRIKPITRHHLKFRSGNNRFIIDFVNKIVQDSQNYENILLYGHSYGGALLNRLSEKLNKLVNEENKSNFSKIKIATFDSIYVANFDRINKINIKNYMAVNEVSLISNKLKSFKFSEFEDKNYKYNEYKLRGYYKKQINNNKEIYWFCMEKSDGEFSCKQDTKPYMGAISSENWIYHNRNYFNILFHLMKKRTNELEGYYDEETPLVEELDHLELSTSNEEPEVDPTLAEFAEKI